jgi:bifunctional non-homologous end joining protein LigD
MACRRLDLEKLTRVRFSNLDKVLYPEAGITKAQVIEYYIRLAPRMLNVLTDRPLALARFPDSIDKPGFYEKDAPLGTPAWVKTFTRYSETAQRPVHYVVCNNLDTLLWLANLAALELHVPLSRMDRFERPDLVLFDIDPNPPANTDNAVEAALLIKEKLDSVGLRSYVKTSGKRGLHVVIPIVREYTFKQTREFVHQIAKRLTRESPIIISELQKMKPPGTVYIDYLQNAHGKTMACPYSLRAVPRAAVSTPLDWKEVKKGLKPEEFTLIKTMNTTSNTWGKLFADKQRLEV